MKFANGAEYSGWWAADKPVSKEDYDAAEAKAAETTKAAAGGQ